MNSQKGISVIIPCYNDGRYIREAVQSIYAQNTKLPFEIIVVDDGSVDLRTKEELQKLKTDHPDIQLIYHEQNRGLSAARNTGLDHANYPYIFPLDADDKLETNPEFLASGGGYLDRSVAHLETNPDTVLVRCRIRLFDAVNFSPKKYAYDEKKILSRHAIGPFPIYRKQEADEAGRYKEYMVFAEDWDFNIAMLNQRRMQGKAAAVHYIEDPLFCYRQRQDKTSMTSNQKMTIKQVLTQIIRRSPQIYRHYYPSLAGEALVENVLKDRRAQLIEDVVTSAKKCIFYPYRSALDGSLLRAWQKSPYVLSRVLSHFDIIAAEPLAAHYQPPVQTHEF